MRLRVLPVVALALSLLLGGCGESGPDPVTTASGASGHPAANPSADATAGQTAVQTSARKPRPSATKAPSLPPGDPGLDAPAVPDPGVAADEHEHEHEHGAGRRVVPVRAMLTPGTVGMTLGGSWTRHAGGEDECLVPRGALGRRATSYGAARGLVVETVATYEDGAAADGAVASLGAVARECGWTTARDPRLGSASVAATDQARSMVAVSAEGVLVLLVGTGDFTRDPGRWGSLVDLALGTSCPAAPDGCH